LDEDGRARFQAEADKDKERYKIQLAVVRERQGSRPKGTLQPAPADKLKYPPLGQDSSKNPEYTDRDHYEMHNVGEGAPNFERRSAHDYHYPDVNSPPGHYLAATHVDYYRGYAPSAFVPPHPNPNGPRSTPLHATHHYPPHFGYPLHPLNRARGPNHDSNPHQQTAHYGQDSHSGDAFSPPHYDNKHTANGHVNPPSYQGASEFDPADEREFAFQCEICNNAVFNTFEECAAHEEQCVPRRFVMDAVGYGHRSQKAEADNRQQAVEAVMMLKEPIEC